MSTYDDMMMLEGAEEADEMELARAMQRQINSGSVWSLQGSFGRAAMRALESGRAMLGKQPARDYYGNYIPARHEVADGTKGSYSLVRDTMGAKYAKELYKL